MWCLTQQTHPKCEQKSLFNAIMFDMKNKFTLIFVYSDISTNNSLIKDWTSIQNKVKPLLILCSCFPYFLFETQLNHWFLFSNVMKKFFLHFFTTFYIIIYTIFTDIKLHGGANYYDQFLSTSVFLKLSKIITLHNCARSSKLIYYRFRQLIVNEIQLITDYLPEYFKLPEHFTAIFYPFIKF